MDPLVNKKIIPTDIQRSIRAFEVKSYTKKSLFEWFENTKSKYTDKDFIKIYIDFPRQDLLDRISLRTDQMFKQGAIKEVKKFLSIKLRRDNSVKKVIGVNEISDFLNKKSTLNEVKEKITIKTRKIQKIRNKKRKKKSQNNKKYL